MIEAAGIAKSFGRTRALEDVSFRISAGEVVGLLGPNGSGKTTLLRILTAFFPPDRGEVLVAGARVSADPLEVRERVGFLPEQAPLYPEMTVARMLEFAAAVKVRSAAGRAERVEAALEECGLRAHRARRIGALSKGYRQRVGIAQALVGRPPVLILDEPTAGLDPATVLELRRLIRGLRGRTTVLLSSHILADVASICDRVLILHRGRLVLADPLDRLRRQVRSATEIVLRTRADREALQRRLGSIAALREVRVAAAERGELLVHLLHAGGGDPAAEGEICAAVAGLAVAEGWPVLELGPRRRTLEDLFAEVLEGGR